MMKKVQVIDKETIKPSSPTPPHLRIFNLSLIDQYIVTAYIPFILFYSPKTEIDHNELNNARDRYKKNYLDRLKASLSETLTLYYQLAGRFSENIKIICDDGGVDVLNARVSSPLSEVLNRAEPETLSELIPCDYYQHRDNALVVVQFNVFECGGIAVGVCFSHKAGDALSLSMFLTTWASISRGSSPVLRPELHGVSTQFPPSLDVPLAMHVERRTERLVSKRFVFNAFMISSLKSKAPSPYQAIRSRVLPVIVLLWKTLMAADKQKHGRQRPSYVGIGVNLRTKLEHPISQVSFGNLVLIAPALATDENDDLVEQLAMGVGTIDSEYARKLLSKAGYSKMIDMFGEYEEQFSRGEIDRYGMTSLCRFPFYEVDFGWGKPVWLNFPGFEEKNLIVLMDTQCGKGVEAWVTLEEDAMALFQSKLTSMLQLSSNL
ncbi:hypothetical protein Syun_016679 [Stephania yunnanensis]|uniref:Uncharacterized protein n=1 Tax=Stephania yunnanensis TaxID=152371 RepID=A0AAP0P1Q2_9MAGN